jgi:hypothetical protein
MALGSLGHHNPATKLDRPGPAARARRDAARARCTAPGGMDLALARTLVLSAALYLGAGLLFALAFVSRGVAVVDPAARGSSLGFRALLVPGAALLWPLLLRRWWRRAPPPAPHDAHRDAAASSQGAHR